MFRRMLLALAAGFSFAAHAALPPPVTLTPTGTVASFQAAYPTYRWKGVPGATRYRLLVQTAAGADVFEKKVDTATDAVCRSDVDSTLTCEATPNTFGSVMALANNASYYWFAAALNTAETEVSPWSVGRLFTVISEKPSAPHQVVPSGTASTMTPFYLWAPTVGATSYAFELKTAGGLEVFSAALTLAQAGCPANTGACGIEVPAALEPNAQYRWWVRGVNALGAGPAEGEVGLFIGGMAFTTGGPMGPPPAAPVLGAPQGVINTRTPAFTWNPSPGATSYTVLLGNGACGFAGSCGFYAPISLAEANCPTNEGTCSFTWPTPLETGRSYAWQVGAGNANGRSPMSSPGSFSVPSTNPGVPATPVAGSPSGNIDTITPTFLWTPSPGATGYRVVINSLRIAGTSSYDLTLAQALCPANTGACGLTVSPLGLYDAPYSWNVTARNASGSSAPSPAMFFTTPPIPPPPPPVPVLGSPHGGVTSLTPTLLWTPSPGATSYRVRIATTDGESTDYPLTLAQAGCPSNSGACAFVAGPLANNKAYMWSVSASNGVSTSAFSEPHVFMTPFVAGPSPITTAPTLGNPMGPITTLQPMYLWTPVAGASAYSVKLVNGPTVMFETVLTLAQALCPTNAGACGFMPATPLLPGTSYQWSARAENGAGVGPYAAPASFTTQSNVCTASAPPVPVPGAPSGTIATLDPLFLWSPSAGATAYDYRVQDGDTVVSTGGITLTQAMCPANTGACGYQLSAPLAPGRTYTWTVRAANCAAVSDPSAPRTFTTP